MFELCVPDMILCGMIACEMYVHDKLVCGILGSECVCVMYLSFGV
jgi:hypothetical protein